MTVAECLSAENAAGFKKWRVAIRKALAHGEIEVENAKPRKTTEVK